MELCSRGNLLTPHVRKWRHKVLPASLGPACALPPLSLQRGGGRGGWGGSVPAQLLGAMKEGGWGLHSNLTRSTGGGKKKAAAQGNPGNAAPE